MEILTTLDNKTVCNVISWPPRRNGAGHWELAVQGGPFVFNLLSDYQGCNFRIGGIEFCNLIFIEREIVSPRDEMEFSTMIFAKIAYSEANTMGDR